MQTSPEKPNVQMPGLPTAEVQEAPSNSPRQGLAETQTPSPASPVAQRPASPVRVEQLVPLAAPSQGFCRSQ